MSINDDIDKKVKEYSKRQIDIMGDATTQNVGVIVRLQARIHERNQKLAAEEEKLNELNAKNTSGLSEEEISKLEIQQLTLKKAVVSLKRKTLQENEIDNLKIESQERRNTELTLDKEALSYIKGYNPAPDKPDENEKIRKSSYNNFIYTKNARAAIRKDYIDTKLQQMNAEHQLVTINNQIAENKRKIARAGNKVTLKGLFLMREADTLQKEKENLENNIRNLKRRASDDLSDYKFAENLLKNAIKNNSMQDIKNNTKN